MYKDGRRRTSVTARAALTCPRPTSKVSSGGERTGYDKTATPTHVKTLGNPSDARGNEFESCRRIDRPSHTIRKNRRFQRPKLSEARASSRPFGVSPDLLFDPNKSAVGRPYKLIWFPIEADHWLSFSNSTPEQRRRNSGRWRIKRPERTYARTRGSFYGRNN